MKDYKMILETFRDLPKISALAKPELVENDKRAKALADRILQYIDRHQLL